MKFVKGTVENLMLILVAVLAGILVSKYVVFVLTVEGCSMEPAYAEGDIEFALVNGVPCRGDVIVVDNVKPGEHLIKRVIGTPGDTVQIVNSRVYVNGEELIESYVPYDSYPSGIAEELVTLDVGEYFVLGDNRPVSYDSRYFGVIKRSDIRGIVIGGRKEG